MKGAIRLKILRAIESGYQTTKALGELITPPRGSVFNYHTTLGQALRYSDRMRQERESASIARQRAAEELRAAIVKRQQLADALYHLKQEGFLIEVKGNTKEHKLILSGKGERLKKVLEKREKLMAPNETRYQLEKDDVIKIISYDIPEKVAWKRLWLRSALHHLEFKFVHKSLWLGQAKLPPDFLTDLVKMKIFEYIEIFSVSKEGTLKKLTSKGFVKIKK